MKTVRILLVALMLAACAKVGTLERPAPLVGARAKQQYQAEKAAAARAAARNPDTQPEPLPDPNDPATWPSTPKEPPVPGQKTNPFGNPPAGVLPQPLTQPGNNGPL
ncbi:MAG TPA: hypothetical protein VGS12_01635 [Caulobacteraceae bacterium]|nr:hypothetical protein [Caulobacteraceae bacterium]